MLTTPPTSLTSNPKRTQQLTQWANKLTTIAYRTGYAQALQDHQLTNKKKGTPTKADLENLRNKIQNLQKEKHTLKNKIKKQQNLIQNLQKGKTQ